MEAITTLDKLSYNLSLGPGIEGYNALIGAVDLSDEELEKVVQWDDDHYQRIRFYDTRSVEGLITCWKEGQRSPVHNYRFQQGWVKVLRGKLKLEYFHKDNGKLKSYNSQVIEEGEIFYLNDSLGFHRFANPGPGNTVALHFYSDKIESWQVYDEGTGEISEQKTRCDRSIEM